MLLLRHLCGIGPSLPDGTPPLLRGSSLDHARDAFALAQSCSSMLRLFTETCLTRIDAAHVPRDVDPTYEAYFVWSRHQSVRHLKAVVRMAGKNLQELHLPPYQQVMCSVEPVIGALATHCPNVHTLSFQETDGISLESMKLLFEGIGVRLLSLCVGSPGLHTLQALTRNAECWLRDVEFTGMDPRNNGELVHFIKEKGKSLDSLRILFENIDKYMQLTAGNDHDSDLGSILPFKQFLATQLLSCCPNLRSFDIGMYHQSPSRYNSSQGCTIDGYLYENEVTAVSKFLVEQEPCFRKRKTPLENLRVLTANHRSSIWDHITDLSALIGPDTHVELQLPGACLVLKTASRTFDLPFYLSRHVAASTSVIKALGKNENAFDKLERLSTSISSCPRWLHGLGRDRFQEQFKWLCKFLCAKAGSNLKTLRIEFEVKAQADLFNADLLDISELAEMIAHAPHVISLEVSRFFVCLSSGDSNEEWLVRAMLGNLRSIHLLVETTEASPRFNFGIVKALPAFLCMIEKHCPYIEAIYLHRGSNELVFDFGCSDRLRQCTRSAVNAIEYFESQRPKVDVSTIKSQVLLWMIDCY